jgi:hypothetical protein
MTARTGSSAKPSNLPTPQPPELTPELAVRLASIARRPGAPRRQPAAGELWLQADASPDGWIRCRVVEVGLGSILLLAHHSPTIAQGTWARLPSSGSAAGGTEAEQVRVFPLALHRLTDQAPGAPVGPVAIECETPLDPALVARFSSAA